MSPEKQRIAIAEACGWVPRPPCYDGRVRFYENSQYPHPPRLRSAEELPDYLNDLNAMQQAKDTLPESRHGDYEAFLLQVCCPDNNEAEGEFELDSFWPCIHATATERAEAFLRTIGKWEEG